MVINNRQFLAILWTFELLLHFDQLFFPLIYKVRINYAPVIHRIDYLSEDILCLINFKIVTDILKKPENKKKIKKVTRMV